MTARPPLTATYRLQFGPDLGFERAADLVPHLKRLGISHVYASPITTARPGSTHGYDVVDPGEVSPALGGLDGLMRLSEALVDAGLGLIIDIVPNHMATHWHNASWMDVLELGRAAPSAATFDIDWPAPAIALPYLDAPLDECFMAGRLHLAADLDAGRILVVHHDHRLPLRPATSGALFAEAARRAGDEGAEAAARAWAAVESAPGDVPQLRARLVEALSENPAVGAALDALLAEATEPSEAAAKAFSDLVAGQHWAIDHWRTRDEAIGYRRFFEIDALIGVRVEDPAVFDQVHALPLSLVREGIVDGLRVDHIDGLVDPAGYCETLRAAVGSDVTIHVEKILTGDERLRPWPIEGTTGYEAMNWIGGLSIARSGWTTLETAARATDPELASDARVARTKKSLLEGPFGPDVDRLMGLASEAVRHGPDEDRLHEVLVAVLAAFPVYRTYLPGDDGGRDEDLTVLDTAVERAFPEGTDDPAALDAVLDLLRSRAGAAAAFRDRFQQLTGALTAKAVEDTELYRHVVLTAGNEVGARFTDPAVAPSEFHARFADRNAHWPKALTPLSTHDTKRSEDVRARLSVLSEMPEAWLAAVARWQAMNADFRTEVGGTAAPDSVDEALIYQTLVGAWPINCERMTGYLLKAMREGERRSSWTKPDEAYEQAVTGFATALLEDERAADFRDDLVAFAETIIPAGRRNGFAHTVLQMTVPGVPDVFQGGEAWDLSLVDPDNRRPVDWDLLLDVDLDAPPCPVGVDESGATRMRAISLIGTLRRTDPELFLKGAYLPLVVTRDGRPTEEIVAFARTAGERAAIIIAAVRGLAAGESSFGDVSVDLPPELAGSYRGLLGDRRVTVDAAGDFGGVIDADRPAEVLVRTAPGGEVPAA